MTRDSAEATPSNVLWSSFSTITRQAPPRPSPGPAMRGRSIVSDTLVPLPVPLEAQPHLVGRRGLDQALVAVHLVREVARERLAVTDLRQRRVLAQVGAHGVQ